MANFPIVAVASPDGDGMLGFSAPIQTLCAWKIDEVCEVITAAVAAIDKGLYIAGFVGYEAAGVFDNAYHTHLPLSHIPLAWFIISDSPPQPFALWQSNSHFCGKWRVQTTRSEYQQNVETIQRHITAGDVYQVNLTHRLQARFSGCVGSFFTALSDKQPSQWRFFAETPSWGVCSVSPECFFEHADGVLLSQPMKGTMPLRRDAAKKLINSEKDRAENLMIVDMLRNDMSKISDAKQVHVKSLLDIREYPTVTQMTSTVACHTSASLRDIFMALFPCASITGAPKIAAMQLIRRLEKSPRGVYCGACGWAGGGVKRFNVAIRTVVIDRLQGIAEYGTGSGIVADSKTMAEWHECKIKTAILDPSSEWYLIETMRAEDEKTPLLFYHLQRMAKSARYFGITFSKKTAAQLIAKTCEGQTSLLILRLRLSVKGQLSVTHKKMVSAKNPRLCLSSIKVDSKNELLRHKTTQRGIYDTAMQAAKIRGFDDALLQNERGEITETCIANIVIDTGDKLITPPVDCGLLPGVQRRIMLEQEKIIESVLTVNNLRAAKKIYRINAARGIEEIQLVL